MSEAAALLEGRGLGKSYPGVRALEGVDFTVRAGEVHGLIGENGAGKSTLVAILAGARRPDAGTLLRAGRSVRYASPAEAQADGVACVFQELELLPELSVTENLFAGRQLRRGAWLDWRGMHREAQAALARVQVDVPVQRPLGSYPLAVQQLVAITRALLSGARVVILDEPTSSLSSPEVETLFRIVADLKAQGLGLVFVSHFLEQVEFLSDRVTILRNGARVGTFARAALTRQEWVERMVGGAGASLVAGRTAVPAPAEPVLEARAVQAPGRLAPLDLELARGEVVGIAGLLGCGARELFRMLFGCLRARGTLRVRGRARRLSSPREAIRAGIGAVFEDRRADGLFPRLSLEQNVLLALRARRGFLRRRTRRDLESVAALVERLRVRAHGLHQPVAHLSGGNQQKALLARWLLLDLAVLLLEEPTRGVDVGARADLEAVIRELGERGLAVLLSSSEVEELERVAHRAVVLYEGRQVASLRGGELTAARLLEGLAGGAGRGGS